MEIHTIEARSNMMFNVMKDHFKLSYESIGEDIRSQFHIMKEELDNKNISYPKLKNTLTPQKSKKDICLVFDTTFIDDTWYGHTIFKKYFPIITTYSGVCIFEGDFIASNEHQKRIFHEISKHLIKLNHSIFKNSCQYYLVYITNLTNNRINKLIDGLKSEQIFTGYFDFTYSSLLKTYISNIIGQRYFMHNNAVVMSMTEDYNNENINTIGYDFDKYGVKIISISNINYITFLTYKIERPYTNFDISDQLFSLSAISNIALPLKNFRIIIDDNKYQYLKTKKRVP